MALKPAAAAPAPVEIRRADHRDRERVLALWLDLIEHHAAFDALFTLRAGAEDEARRLLDAQLRDSDTAFFVSGERGRLTGFCSARIDRAPPIHREVARAEITDLAVRGECRRRGIGRALVQAALAWVRGRGVWRVEVRVATRNTQGQQFWRALDFGPFMDVLQRRL